MRSPPRPLSAGCRRPPTRSSTCSPSCTPHGRTGSLPPDHNLNDYSRDHPDALPDALAPHRHGGPLRVGLGGPVGSGKTALAAALCRTLGAEYDLAVVTNDIYTTEDADFLRRNAVLPDDRIEAVQTGCCPPPPTTGSSPCRPAAARTPRSATTSPPISTPSNCSRGGTPGSSWSSWRAGETTWRRASAAASSTRRCSSSTSPGATRFPARAVPVSPPPIC